MTFYSTYNSFRRHKIISNKFNQRYAEPLYRKLQTLLRKIKDNQINGEIYHFHGLEDLMFLTCQFFLKLIYRSIQSKSRNPREVFFGGGVVVFF